MQYKNLIVDGPYLSHRSNDAPYNLSNDKGERTTLIHSFLRSLNALNKKFNPEKIFITWESHGTPSWRRKLYPKYKPSKKVPESFLAQQYDIQCILNMLNITQYYSPTNEADDVIATLVEKYPSSNLIFTVDKDIMQVITDTTHIWNGSEIITANEVFKKFGITPSQIPDLLAIMGDTSDNIKGVKGYGIKKTAQILRKYPAIEYLPDNILLDFCNTPIKTNKKLTQLNSFCELKPVPTLSFLSIKEILNKYQLTDIISKLPEYQQLDKTKNSSLKTFF